MPEGKPVCIRRGNANGPCCREMRCRMQYASGNHGIRSLTCQIDNSGGGGKLRVRFLHDKYPQMGKGLA
ncbi:hypothetical protein AA0521_2552 [Komagataeibacter intermedius NRIC 0521]|uniref:Uncharacterized protein n=1 Tax=Komagataeibacter intermedius NRIC 0521 TaxID=1307934 RepID=A0ABQ0PKV0_9PROT|nr:hypothetical protein AA0521_2552 [Komagataeibacter intermedius NRIC 0521]